MFIPGLYVLAQYTLIQGAISGYVCSIDLNARFLFVSRSFNT